VVVVVVVHCGGGAYSLHELVLSPCSHALLEAPPCLPLLLPGPLCGLAHTRHSKRIHSAFNGVPF